MAAARSLPPLDALDREDAITGWPDSRKLADGWRLAPALVTGGADVPWLEHVTAEVDARAMEQALRWLAATNERDRGRRYPDLRPGRGSLPPASAW